MKAQPVITRELVRVILLKAQQFSWTIQGFGMLRLHLSDAVRLNIWHKKFRVPNVSMMHMHPWNFESQIVCGVLKNVRYRQYHTGHSDIGNLYSCAAIKPGPGGGIREPREALRLYWIVKEQYTAGDIYCQAHDEIHVSLPEDGTVTLNYRERIGEDTALVFWPEGEEWVSAEPRHAEPEEVREFVEQALAVMEAG